MYKSLIKSCRTVLKEQDTVVIDTNALIAEKLSALAQEDRTHEGNRILPDDAEADGLDEVLRDRDGEAGGEFTQGLTGFAQKVEAAPEPTGPSPEELLEEARQQAEEMKREAAAQIEQERAAALAQAKKEGYDAGYGEGMRQAESLKQEAAAAGQRMAEEYEKKLNELEPLFIETLTGIYEHIFKVNLENDKQVLLYLAENTIRNIEGSREFFVHVSREDYAAVNMQKKQLEAAAAGAGTSVEIVQDATLSGGACMIETDGGIFDCGLGTQLSELTKQLKLLAYSGE